MGINDYETSTESGQPVELYQFIFGTEIGAQYFYTNAEQDITYGANIYVALPLDRDKIVTKGRGESQEIELIVPLASPVSELFRVFPPGRPVSIIMRQGHLPNDGDPAVWADGEFPVVWTGRVLESNRKKNTTSLSCQSSASGLKRVGLRKHYQWPCPLVLYGARCRADKAAALQVGTVDSISGNEITLQAGWEGTKDPNHFFAGVVEWDGTHGREYRTILGITGDVLKLNATTLDLAALDTVDVYLGCPHTFDGCVDQHNNIVNYGGHPYIPLKNPVGKNNHS